jgi:alkylation response protein AidB-like acyl-CoA dehydrogenase
VIDLELADQHGRLRVEATGRAESGPSLTRVRQLIELGAPIDHDELRDVGRRGWLSLPGEPGGVAAAAAVAEVRGASLQPGPIVPMTVVVLGLGGSPSTEHRAVAERLNDGGATASWVWADRHGSWTTTPAISASPGRGGPVLNGIGGLVQDGHQVDWLMVRAATAEGERSFLVAADADGVTRTPLDSFDLTRSWSTVAFDDAAVTANVAIDDHGPLVERQLQVAATLSVAEMVGAMERLLARTVQYAKERVAFGRPIGSFQAIKHLLADASVAVETSAAMAAAAVRAVDDRTADAGQIASMAKAFVGDAALEVANACWQTHGGIAYTWQHDFHLYLRRLTAEATLYGDPTFHRERLCVLNGLGAR